MILPIPLTNTAPAMVIFIIGVAMTEDDGLGMLAACGLAVCAVLLYIGVFWAISYYGLQGVDELKRDRQRMALERRVIGKPSA